MTTKAIFFCGDASPYGIAHLEPIHRYFDLRALVLADAKRWAQFRTILRGGEEYSYRGSFSRVLKNSKYFLRYPLSIYQRLKHQSYLKSFGIPVYVVNDANSTNTLELVRSISPEILLCAAYPQIFGKTLINIPARGAINFHPSLLPRFRGAHPHYWSLFFGEKMGGITAHFMTTNIDDGDVVAQRSFPIEDLYYVDHYKRIVGETPMLVKEVADFLSDPQRQAIPQDPTRSCYFRNDREIHRRLDFDSMGAKELHDRIRAGGAFAIFRGAKLTMSLADISQKNRHMTNGLTLPPAIIADISSDGVWVTTRDNRFLRIKAVSFRGKNMDFRKWIARESIQIGERLS